MLAFFESEGAKIAEKMGEVRVEGVKKTVASLLAVLSDDEKDAVLKGM